MDSVEMTKGDIITMPTGRRACYLGGVLGLGARFCYVDDSGKPMPDPDDKRQKDTFYISSTRLLAKLQPEVSHG